MSEDSTESRDVSCVTSSRNGLLSSLGAGNRGREFPATLCGVSEGAATGLAGGEGVFSDTGSSGLGCLKGSVTGLEFSFGSCGGDG